MQNPIQFKSAFSLQNKGKFHTRAKFIPDPENGGYKLAMVQGFTFPMFNPEKDRQAIKRDNTPPDLCDIVQNETKGTDITNVERASRRAKINAFDKILCNPDLDTFATFTFAPGFVSDKASWDDCYHYLKTWLGNRVQRNGLKYVIVPERHKSGDVHFHGILNSSALRLERAFSPRTGRALTHNGNPLFNVTDWQGGFTSAEMIRGAADDRTKVAKYIFKYMGKQCGTKIGGRYMLSGGDLVLPLYVYDDAVEPFLDGIEPTYQREVDLGEKGKYMEYSFL